MEKRGSAILIAVFLVAAVGSAAFAIGRLFLMDAAISDKYESSVIAYYAAESGIEEGLLRYRYDKNQEVLADGSARMPIINLTDITQASNNPSFYVFEPLKKYYVPSVEYLTEFYGEDVAGNSNGLDANDIAHADYPEIYRIPKDEAIKLDLSGLAPNPVIMLFVKYKEADSPNDFNFSICGNNCPFIEVALTGQTPASGSNLYQSKMALVANNYTNSFNANDYISSRIDVATQVITYNNLLNGIRTKNADPIFDTTNDQLTLTLKALYADAIIGIKATVTTPGTNVLPAPYNTIKSTGYFGGVTRTLEAKIDRQAGTVYDLFDYVLYQYN